MEISRWTDLLNAKPIYPQKVALTAQVSVVDEEPDMATYLSNEGCIIVTVNARLLPSHGTQLYNLIGQLDRAANVPNYDYAAELLDRQQLSEVTGALKKFGSIQRVLLAGGYLEDQISVIALHLLAEGYDITLLEEWLEPRQPAFRRTYQNRLIQAGAVQSTLRQMLYQWSAVEGDANIRAELAKLLVVIDALSSQQPNQNVKIQD